MKKLLLILLAACSTQAAVIFSDNFDSENGGVGVTNYGGLANWDVTKGSVDLIGNGFFDFYPGNGLYLDMDGSSIDSGGITSKTAFNLAPGTYVLTFDLGGSQRGDTNTVRVVLGSVFSEDFTLDSSAPLGTIIRVINVGAAESANLSFTSQDPRNNIGLILDDVLLESRSTDVPEPATLVLMAAGFGTLLLRSRRR